jgi:hypothetical protein
MMQGVAVADGRRVTKTENLSIRLDPKTKFILDFVVRMKGVRTTDLVARAIKELADATRVRGNDENGFEYEKGWLNFWHPEEGVRILNLILDADIPTTFDEDELAEFVKQHWEFFFGTANYKNPIPVFIQVLWPDIQKYLNHWRENKSISRWGTGDLMLKAIKAAGMRGPDWPRQTSKPSVSKKPTNDLDDEIPF